MNSSLVNWKPRPEPGSVVLEGQYCCLEPYDSKRHLAGLFAAVCGSANDALWDFIPMGPFENEAALAQTLAFTNAEHGWRTMVICRDQDILGMASFMRIREAHGSAEVGCVVFGPTLQRTRESSESIYLFGKHLFEDLGYRRFEWKCNNGNEASKRAAVRFGFQFEGVFRNDMVVKGQNRDTAWFSITNDEWPEVDQTFKRWLRPENFDLDGTQIKPLRS